MNKDECLTDGSGQLASGQFLFYMGDDQHKNPNMNNNKDLLGGQLTTDYRARGPTYLEPFDDTYLR